MSRSLRKLYAVRVDQGSYDDQIQWIDSVWEKQEDAEARKDKYVNKMKEWLEAPRPEKIRGSYPDHNININSEAYCKWEDRRDIAKDFNTCEVKEFELNKIEINL